MAMKRSAARIGRREHGRETHRADCVVDKAWRKGDDRESDRSVPADIAMHVARLPDVE
jgi:hypothetical protein